MILQIAWENERNPRTAKGSSPCRADLALDVRVLRKVLRKNRNAKFGGGSDATIFGLWGSLIRPWVSYSAWV
jgi:hypothetical protein